MPGRFAGIVQAVFGEFYRKAVKRTLVQAGNKALYHLVCEKLKRADGLEFIAVDVYGHRKG